jgi:hypothetical protein
MKHFLPYSKFTVFHSQTLTEILSRVGCVTRQLTSRLIAYSEFIPLALTFTPFTISQLLSSAVSQLRLLM